MYRYPLKTINEVKILRRLGKTYREINTCLHSQIPKTTLNSWCKNVAMPNGYSDKINLLNLQNLIKARAVSVKVQKEKRDRYFRDIREINTPIAQKIDDKIVAKIALAMLCLGEASKYNPAATSSFCLGNSDPRIITLFIQLLKKCFNFNVEKVRCTVQCRADQDTRYLEDYWMKVTNIPKRLFYKSRIDPRTIGKPTKKKDYKGVLKVEYFDNNVRLELESLADIIYNRIRLYEEAQELKATSKLI